MLALVAAIFNDDELRSHSSTACDAWHSCNELTVEMCAVCLAAMCNRPPPLWQAFTYFDKDNDAQLTVREMKDSVVAVFKERKNMAHSLKVSRGVQAALELMVWAGQGQVHLQGWRRVSGRSTPRRWRQRRLHMGRCLHEPAVCQKLCQQQQQQAMLCNNSLAHCICC